MYFPSISHLLGRFALRQFIDGSSPDINLWDLYKEFTNISILCKQHRIKKKITQLELSKLVPEYKIFVSYIELYKKSPNTILVSRPPISRAPPIHGKIFQNQFSVGDRLAVHQGNVNLSLGLSASIGKSMFSESQSFCVEPCNSEVGHWRPSYSSGHESVH